MKVYNRGDAAAGLYKFSSTTSTVTPLAEKMLGLEHLKIWWQDCLKIIFDLQS